MVLAKLDMLAMLGMAEIEDMEDIFGTEGIDMDRLGTEVGAESSHTILSLMRVPCSGIIVERLGELHSGQLEVTRL